MPFIGRTRELEALREENWRERCKLVVVYGRRRVGKTALVEHAYENETLWKFEGIEHGNTQTQIAFFLKQLSYCACPDKDLEAADWHQALTLLNEMITSAEKSLSRRLVIFLDEFQWLCEMKTGLVSIFKYFYDNFLSGHPRCVFVICGSISSFIVKRVLQSRALYGRVDLEIALLPLSVAESREFLAGSLLEGQALDVHMILGGVPQYLLELNPRMSLVQNLNEYAFKPHGFFFREFQRLFISHFVGSPIYEKVLRALSRTSMAPAELSQACGVMSGGGFTERLLDLELAGFIERQVPVDKKASSRLVRYRICDEFLHFYFRFIAPHSPEIISGGLSFAGVVNTRDYPQWQGVAFERLCRKHAGHIADVLRFSAVGYKQGAWFKRATATPGAQVDLVFVRADKVLTACEIKYTTKIQPSWLRDSFVSKVEQLQSAFPSYAIDRVLILGKSTGNLEALKPHFDHVLTAGELFGQ